MQRLRVLHVAREGIEPVEPAGGGIVVPGASLRSIERDLTAMHARGERQCFGANEEGQDRSDQLFRTLDRVFRIQRPSEM